MAVDIKNLPEPFAIGQYIPAYEWAEDDDFGVGYSRYLLDLKRGCDQVVEECTNLLYQTLKGFDAVTVVPSHRPNNYDSGIYQVAQGLAFKRKVIDATKCFYRHREIEKVASGGSRDIEVHLRSIELRCPDLITGKRVLLLDDIRATGNTLKACQQILSEAKPALIRSVIFGQSFHDGMVGEPPIMDYGYAGYGIEEAFHKEVEALECYKDLEHRALDQLRDFAY